MKLLLENQHKRADPTLVKQNGLTALHMTVVFGHIDVTRYLLDVDGIDINAQSDISGSSLCGIATKLANRHDMFFFDFESIVDEDALEICKLLIKKGV